MMDKGRVVIRSLPLFFDEEKAPIYQKSITTSDGAPQVQGESLLNEYRHELGTGCQSWDVELCCRCLFSLRDERSSAHQMG
jgi:hypothetical protein